MTENHVKLYDSSSNSAMVIHQAEE